MIFGRLLFLLGALVASAHASNNDVKVVHVISSCHLDVGFADTAPNIVNRYFDHFFSMAINVSTTLRAMGQAPQLKFMTHGYLIWLYFNCPPNMGVHCPATGEIAQVKAALQRGDLWLHAFPFNAEAEVLDNSMFGASIDMVHALNDLTNVSRATVMSQRDVPGTTRSIIPVLRSRGIEALSVGVNTASMPPAVPRIFVWKDPVSTKDIIAMWHPHGYGGIEVQDCVVIPGFEHALCPVWRGDNSGPPGVDEVQNNWKILEKEFPGAKIIASTYDAFVAELAPIRSSLPVVSEEFGDTWIHGVASDPFKLAANREMMRARRSCFAAGRCNATDFRVTNFTNLMTKNSEHTWGLDVKSYLRDWGNWSNVQLQTQLTKHNPNFDVMWQSWVRQRDWGISYPLQALEDHELASDIRQRLAALLPTKPSVSGWNTVPFGQTVACGKLSVAFDRTGAISQLQDEATKEQWASSANPLAQLVYNTYTQTDYNTFFNEYAQRIDGKIPSYFPWDFGKNGVAEAHPNTTSVTPIASAVYTKDMGDSVAFVVDFAMDADHHNMYGAPGTGSLLVSVDKTTATLNVTLQLYDKTATRLPEAMFLRFNPSIPSAVDSADSGWKMDKMGELIAPLDIQTNASRHLHSTGLDHSLVYQRAAPKSSLSIHAVDSPLVCWGHPTGFPTPTTEPDLSKGANFVLSDNIWGTNYIMWYPFVSQDVNMQFRYTMSLASV